MAFSCFGDVKTIFYIVLTKDILSVGDTENFPCEFLFPLKKSEKELGKRGQILCYSFATFSTKPSHVSSLSAKYPYPTSLLCLSFLTSHLSIK